MYLISSGKLIGALALALLCLAMALAPAGVLAGSISGAVTDTETLEPIEGVGITGTVTRKSDGEPVEEVEVCAWPLNPKVEGTSWECGYTQADGTYFIGLEPGTYRVEFWPGGSGQNLALQFYDGKNRIDEGDNVTVEPGERTNGIDAELDPGATISGTVSSIASGVGLKGTPVCSVDSPSGGLLTCNWTAADGSYSLHHLPEDQYKVIFSINFSEWFGEPVFMGADDGYATQFWNNQVRLATANVIPLSTGQSVGGIDARLGNALTRSVITPVPPVVHPRRKHCRKGYVRKKVKGKVRCVKRHKHHRHRHHHVTR